MDYGLTDIPCPDPLTRAPRAGREGARAHDWLLLPPASLQGVLLALIGRDTTMLPMDSAQRLSHFPASPMVTLSWYSGIESGLIKDGRWTPFGSRVVMSGTHSHPVVSWSPTCGRGFIACFSADVAQALFEVDLAVIQDRFVPVEQVLDTKFAPLWEDLLAADDASLMAVLERHLAPRLQALQGRNAATPSLRQLGRNWVERLAWQAHSWRSRHSARHVERRVKAFSGRSLREWESLVKTEGLFFAARDRYEAGQPFEWAALAQDEGFADQAHMSRTAKRITGFSPSEFAERFIEDESFWVYRLWV